MGTQLASVQRLGTRALHPRVLLPGIFAACLLVGLLVVSNAGAVLHDTLTVQPGTLVFYLFVMLAYEAVRTLQWLLWLRAIGVRAPLGVRVFAFLAGEGGIFLPAGNYLRNYLLRQAAGTAYGSSAPASAASLLLENGVALAAAGILGIPGWGWLRPTAFAVLAGLATTVTLLYLLMRVAHLPQWITSRMRLRWLVEEAGRFREASLLLGHPRLVAIQAGLGALYLACGGTGLYVILQGLGLHQMTFPQALGVYAFSLAVGLLAPLPLDLGVIEVSGVGALVACGVPQSVAVSAMLLQRVLSGGYALLMAGAVVTTFKRARRAALAGTPVALAGVGTGALGEKRPEAAEAPRTT
ncbi:MAG TPA: lysylphosphatidylglycerol synthase transmembrane domain-containing protein [Ktedonobacterales bacterium]